MAVSTSRPIRTPLPGVKGVTTAEEQRRYARGHLTLWYLGALGFAGLLCAALVLLGPSPAAIAWIVLLTVLATALYNPRYGLYALVGLAMLFDGRLARWYPFTRNFSSAESLLFVHDAVIINPAELLLVTILVSWLGRMLVTRRLDLYLGPIFVPALAFISFVTLGFFYGMSRGGDLTIALWTFRPILYLPLAILLVSNLIKSRDHVMHLIWAAMIALAVSGFSGFLFVAIELQWNIKSVLEIADHSYSIYLNSMFVLLIALAYFGGSPRLRWFLLVTLPFVLVAYVGNQRRAGYVALVVALLALGLLSQWFNRRVFWSILPPVALVLAIYTGIFWNSTAPAAAVAQEIRAIIAPIEDSEEASSNLYRELENTNILYTIKQAPLTGVGMGQKFLIIAPMPDISFFIWWEYFTHNAILWMWMQAGVGGFVAMLAVIGTAISLGVRTVFLAPRGPMRAVAFWSTSYMLMHFTFAYVDMSWGSESMIYLGMHIGLINILARIIAQPVALPQRRWPWQREPEQPPGLQPV
ncbi:MAG TPA: O-antigen ligase family protein [Chloroflexaceae bacterium]|nr:O-antigen ligase family protein [Chloroflexaceae bacterium]